MIRHQQERERGGKPSERLRESEQSEQVSERRAKGRQMEASPSAPNSARPARST